MYDATATLACVSQLFRKWCCVPKLDRACLLQKAARHAANDERRKAQALPTTSASQDEASSSSPSGSDYTNKNEPAEADVQQGACREEQGGQGRGASGGRRRSRGKGKRRGKGRVMQEWGHDGFKQLYGHSG